MKPSLGEKVFLSFNALLLTLAALSCLLPIVHVASLSLSDQHSILSGAVNILPRGLNLDSYKLLIEGTRILRSLWNSVLITGVGTALSMLFTIMAAYPLSKRYMFGRRFFTLAIVFTMLFSGGLIPSFLVIKSLGLLDTYGAIWLPSLVSTFYMLIMRTFFEGLPAEMEEAARIDGSGEWGYLMKIALPLSLPMLATISLFYGVSYWNSFFSLLIFIQSSEKYNLAVLVQQMVQSQSLLQEVNNSQSLEQATVTPEGIKAAAIMVMIVPMLLVYPFLQKYFVKGAMIGAIKG
ncbi:MAG: transporter permease subunit [Paenibacillus sp.]|nr:transporter permease subunit [Paenibacillus sp.]